MVLGLSLLFLVFVGCGEDNGFIAPPTGHVDALTIICNPLSPAPGDTAQLTAQASGYSPGAWPTYEWEVESGVILVKQVRDTLPDTFIVDNKGISVFWLVPDTTGVFNVSLKAYIDQSLDSLKRNVMIRHFTRMESPDTLNPIPLYAIYPYAVGSQLYFLGSDLSPYHPDFVGYNVYKSDLAGPVLISECKVENCTDGGLQFIFYPDANMVLASMVNNPSIIFRQQLVNVFLFPFFKLMEDPENLSNDFEKSGSNARRNQHLYPYGDSDLNMVVWQEVITGQKPDGTDDLINIHFFRRSDALSMTVTTSVDSFVDVYGNMQYNYWNNILPSFTPDGENILFFRDTTGTFEPCLIPIDVDEPLPDSMKVLEIFKQAGIYIKQQTIFQWNPKPASNILGFTDAGNHLCFFDYSTGDVQKFTELGEVEEFVWSPDGEMSAVVTERGVSILVSGIEIPIFEKEKMTDEMKGLNWSRSTADLKLAFRMIRKGKKAYDSYSAIVLYSYNEGNWYYASPRISWDNTKDPDANYIWMRVEFDQEGGIYAPIPAPDEETPEGTVEHGVCIYHSFE